jgi:hypothetical protein
VRGDPESQAKAWLATLAEADEERRGYQRLAAKGLMTDDELAAELLELEETCATARRELDALSHSREKILELERDKEAVLATFADAAPATFEGLTPHDRHELYKRLRLRIVANLGGGVQVTGAFGGAGVSSSETLR